MEIQTQITNVQPAFIDGIMTLGSVTIVVNFQGKDDYFGGQVVLNHKDDGIDFTTSEEKLQELGIAKAKALLAEAQPFVYEAPVEEE